MAEQLYFAWVDADEEFDDAVHNREDEEVFSLQYGQSEGDFAGLQITIKNPRIGLLAPGRKQWMILSFNDGTTITPIFRGRLIGIPTNVFAETVTLDFVAKPTDFEDQKVTLANSLKVLPYWDPIFINPDSWEDPDAVLEAYSRLWHIDPVTLEVTASDILIPEDGVEEVTEDQHFYDDMQLTLNSPPLRAVNMIATIPWKQSSLGAVNLTARILDLFGQQIPTSFTMEGLSKDWPDSGTKFGSGWEVVQGSMTDVSYQQPKQHIEDIFSWQGEIPIIPIGSVVFPLKSTGEYHSGETAGFNLQFELVIAQLGYGVPDLHVAYTAGREFGQVVTFTLLSDQQNIVTLPGEDESMTITLNANKVSDPTEDATIPIGDVQSRGFVHSTRGMQAVEHLLLVARAHLLARSRAVEVSMKCGFIEGLRLLSLRKGVLLHDHRIPGGEVTGKIIDAQLNVDGDSGEATATITIASCVGKGGSHTASEGTPCYVDNTLDGTQVYTDQIVLTDTTDIAWGMPDFEPFDDGIDFVKGLTSISAVQQCFLTNGPDTQRAAIMAASAGANTDQEAISSVLQTVPTTITMQMVPMEGGPFSNEVVISVSDLVIPKQIDLEAPSNA